MNDYSKADAFLASNLDASLRELGRLVAQPSISAQNLGLAEAATLVADMLRARGFHAKIYPTAGAPVVVAERKGKSDKTLLFYNHYDVQPPEPLELWESPPFEPQIRDGKMYGRGVSDDKGHLVARLFALDALLAEGDLPCNVKFIVEGEEETASVNLAKFIHENTRTPKSRRLHLGIRRRGSHRRAHAISRLAWHPICGTHRGFALDGCSFGTRRKYLPERGVEIGLGAELAQRRGRADSHPWLLR